MENYQVQNGENAPTAEVKQLVVRKYAGVLSRIVNDQNLSEDEKRSKLVKLMGQVEREIRSADRNIQRKQKGQNVDHYRDARISMGTAFGGIALMHLYGVLFGNSVSSETLNHVAAILGGGSVLWAINGLVSSVMGASQNVINSLAEQSIKDNTTKKDGLKSIQKQICKQIYTDDQYGELGI